MQDHGTLILVSKYLENFLHILYSFAEEALDKELDKYLSSAKKEIKNVQSLKALIAP